MKTTIELHDATFRQAKALAADRGVILKRLFTEALDNQFHRCANETRAGETGVTWMAGF